MSKSPEALVGEAQQLMRLNRVPEAIEAFTRILALRPTLSDCWFNLGFLLRRARRFDDALACYQKAIDTGVSEPETALLNRAVIYTDHLRQDDAAERELRAALALNPGYVPALLNLANLHEDRGSRDQASVFYEAALAADPRCLLALARIANLQPTAGCDAALIARLRAAIADPTASAVDRADLGFALGRALDAGEDFRGAFAAYSAANRDSRASAQPTQLRYDRSAQEQITDRLLATAARAPLAPAAAVAGPRPIFICGMFRSGSTLTEHLLAGHPDVVAGGELDLLPAAIATQLLPFPETLATVPEARLEQIARGYLQAIGRLAPDAAHVTDKRPDNFLCIGLIKTLFPDALIVHTVRNPLDTSLSTFFLHLDHRMPYALDLMDIGHYYRQYRRVMTHWQRLYGTDIVELDYDRLVREPQATARALFESLGLSWDPQFLDFPQAGRAVKTASVWQVREPLYRRSSGRWRNYAAELEPLREYLVDLLPAGVNSPDPE